MTLQQYRNMMLRPTKFRELADALYNLEQKIEEVKDNAADGADIQGQFDSLYDEMANIWQELSSLSNRISVLENAKSKSP